MGIKYSLLHQPRNDGMKYILDEDYIYKSKFFNRTKTLKKGTMSDGATGAIDLGSSMPLPWLKSAILNQLVILIVKNVEGWFKTPAFFVHDEFCVDPYWDDGTPVTNVVASTCLSGILYSDGYWIAAYVWWPFTLLFGGKDIKKTNGWFWI